MLRVIIFLSVLCGSFAYAESTNQKFQPFTGKVLGNKVRLRTKADLDSGIIRQYNKGDLVLVSGQEDEFFAVEPPSDTKAYIYRCYAIDNVVEANRVNVRLEPHVDAPVIGQLQCGDKIDSQVCKLNNKWLEIAPPKSTKFYISREFVSHAGSAEYFATMQKRLDTIKGILHSALLMLEIECNKIYEQMAPQDTIARLDKVIKEYGDFPELVDQAKEGLSTLQENYLQKKIRYLENKANSLDHKAEAVFPDYELSSSKQTQRTIPLSDKMKFWEPIEESLYLTWNAFHPEKTPNDFYREQEVNGSVLTGVIEVYEHNMSNKPGDYVLRGEHAPLAYLYSTKVDLDKYVGQKMNMTVSPRPNHHFAFPAYFVHTIE